MLIKYEFNFETLAVLRMILEQIAWVNCIYLLNDMDMIKSYSPTKSISSLKNLLPSPGAFYGRLSECAHISPGLIDTYISIGEEESSVVYVSRERTAYNALALINLVDYFCVVFEKVYEKYLDELLYIESKEDGCVPRDDRRSRLMLDEYKVKLETCFGLEPGFLKEF